MTATAETAQQSGKSSGKGVIIGLVLALTGAAGGFYTTYSGIVSAVIGGDSHAAAPSVSAPVTPEHGTTQSSATHSPATIDTEFIALEPIIINLGARGQSRHLRFTAQLEVARPHTAEVERLLPRIIDVLNIYLRALDAHEIEEPAALLRLRGQMLRRVQIVTGPGLVNDLLVMEFILN